MYRRNVARTPRIENTTEVTRVSFLERSAEWVRDFLTSTGIIARAERENRRRERGIRRHKKHTSFPYCGKRQQERYGRQVAAGSLKAENGLVV